MHINRVFRIINKKLFIDRSDLPFLLYVKLSVIIGRNLEACWDKTMTVFVLKQFSDRNFPKSFE